MLRHGDDVARMLGGTLLIVGTAYIVSYETLPQFRGALGAATSISAFALVYVSALAARRAAMWVVLFCAFLAGATLLLEATGTTQQWEPLLRYMTSVAGLFALGTSPVGELRRLVSLGAAALIASATFTTVSAGVEIYAGTPRLTPFFANLHSSAITIAAACLIVAFSPWRTRWRFFWLAPALVLLVGYGVVTAWLMVALVAGGALFEKRNLRRSGLFVLAGVLVALGLIFREANSIADSSVSALGVEALGSGRVGAWTERLSEFAARPLNEMILGGGAYSDYRFTEIWWWDAKNAHSDLLAILMEFGASGLVLFAAVIIGVYRSAARYSQLVLLAAVLGMASSNALLDRPSVAVAWGFALYMAESYSHSETRAYPPPPSTQPKLHERQSALRNAHGDKRARRAPGREEPTFDSWTFPTTFMVRSETD